MACNTCRSCRTIRIVVEVCREYGRSWTLRPKIKNWPRIVCYPYTVFGPHVRRFLHHVPLTLILVAAGSWLSAGIASAADARWTVTGAQVAGQPDKPVWSVAV